MQRNADRNMRRLCRDVGFSAEIIRAGKVDDRGFYPYKIKSGKRRVYVMMPGIKLDHCTVSRAI